MTKQYPSTTQEILYVQIVELLYEFIDAPDSTDIFRFANKWAKRTSKLIPTAPKDTLVGGQKREYI